MKIKKKVIGVIVFMLFFTSNQYAMQNSPEAIKSSLDRLKGRLEGLKEKLADLSKNLNDLRFNLDTEKQAEDVINKLNSMDVAEIFKGDQGNQVTKEEKVAIVKRFFYSDKDGNTALKNLVEKKNGVGLDQIYPLLKDIPKSQRVALMDQVVKNLDLSRMSKEYQEEFFTEVVIKNGLSQSFRTMKNKFSDGFLNGWFLEKKKDVGGPQGNQSEGRLTPLYFIEVDNPDLIKGILELYSDDEQINIMKKEFANETPLENMIKRGHLKVIQSLRERNDAFKKLVDDKVEEIFAKKAEGRQASFSIITSFIINSSDPIAAMLFLTNLLGQGSKLLSRLVRLYDGILEKKVEIAKKKERIAAIDKAILLLKTSMREKRDDLIKSDKENSRIRAINLYPESLKNWMDLHKQYWGEDSNKEDSITGNNPLHQLIEYIIKNKVSLEGLDDVLDWLSKNKNLVAMKNAKNKQSSPVTPLGYMQQYGKNVDAGVKNKVFQKLFPDATASS